MAAETADIRRNDYEFFPFQLDRKRHGVKITPVGVEVPRG
jgi:hypothetical protein